MVIYCHSHFPLNLCCLSSIFKLKDDDIQAFLEEATVLDPRFKSKIDRDEIWDRVRASAVAAIEKVFEFDNAFSIYLL